MTLEQKDILQINATVIAGAFIFLSILGTEPHTQFEIRANSMSVGFALIIIAVFSI